MAHLFFHLSLEVQNPLLVSKWDALHLFVFKFFELHHLRLCEVLLHVEQIAALAISEQYSDSLELKIVRQLLTALQDEIRIRSLRSNHTGKLDRVYYFFLNLFCEVYCEN